MQRNLPQLHEIIEKLMAATSQAEPKEKAFFATLEMKARYRGVPGFPVAPGWLFLGKMGKYANGIGNSLEWLQGDRMGWGRYLFFFGQKNTLLEKSKIGEVGLN